MANAITWFEIPVTDMDRALTFYSTVTGQNLTKWEMPGSSEMLMYMFSGDMEKNEVGGALVKSPYHHPSDKGIMIYLNGGADLEEMLDKVDNAGGKVIRPKTLISEDVGYDATFIDTEGNLLAFHSRG